MTLHFGRYYKNNFSLIGNLVLNPTSGILPWSSCRLLLNFSIGYVEFQLLAYNKIQHNLIISHFLISSFGADGAYKCGYEIAFENFIRRNRFHSRISVLTLIGKFLGNFWDRFTGKLIHHKIMSTYSGFFKRVVTGKLIQSSIGKFWGVTQAVLVDNSSSLLHI